MSRIHVTRDVAICVPHDASIDHYELVQLTAFYTATTTFVYQVLSTASPALRLD